MRGRIAIGAEKFLHRVGGVSALAKNLLDRRMAGTFGGKFLANLLELLARFLLILAKRGELRLSVANGGAHRLRVLLGPFEVRGRFVGARLQGGAFAFDGAHRGRALLFGGCMTRCGFLRLLRFGLTARGFLNQGVRQAAKLLHPRLELLLRGRAGGNVFGRFA